MVLFREFRGLDGRELVYLSPGHQIVERRDSWSADGPEGHADSVPDLWEGVLQEACKIAGEHLFVTLSPYREDRAEVADLFALSATGKLPLGQFDNLSGKDLGRESDLFPAPSVTVL